MRLLASIAFLSLVTSGCSDDGSPAAETGTTAAAETSSTGSPGTGVDTGNTSAAESSAGSSGPGSSGSGSAGDTTAATGEPTGTSGGSDTGSTPGACTGPGDCVVVDDCCSCVVIGADDPAPACDLVECEQTACAAFGIDPIPACELGSCEMTDVSCDPTIVACDAIPPACEPGFAPSVEAGCWGPCVPSEYCDVLTTCDCPDDQACVERDTHFGPLFHCTRLPEDCGGVASCACLADDVCVAPYDTCSDGDGNLICTCPVC